LAGIESGSFRHQRRPVAEMVRLSQSAGRETARRRMDRSGLVSFKDLLP
jgi:hypothetical protein